MTESSRELVSVVTPCYNEEENVEQLCAAVRAVFEELGEYDYEHLLIDNFSTDNTRTILRAIARRDPKVKLIFNSRNFGYIRSMYHGVMQTVGDAVTIVAADLQDPPELIKELLKKRAEGFDVVMAVKDDSKEGRMMFAIRRVFYKVIRNLSDDVKMVDNFFGFGVFDRRVVDFLKQMDEPHPYFRGLISEVGLKQTVLKYVQPERKRGSTNFNLYRLYDFAMIALTNYSKIPIRIISVFGIIFGLMSMAMGLLTLIVKLLKWSIFPVGVAALMVTFFFFIAINFMFLGLLGEYILSIHSRVSRKPHVFEMERINFD
mgnify:CR=1 FL=1